MEYIHVSSDSNSFANRLSSSSYVDPPSFNVQLIPDTHHPESVPRSVPKSVSAGRRPSAGRTRTSSFHSKRQPAVAIILQVRRLRSARQPQGSSRNAVERSSEGVFWMEYLRVSLDSNSFANRFSSSNYVDPPSFSVQLTADTHHPESVPGSVPESVSRPAVGRPYTELKLS